jgi:hypothetical protein
MVIYVVAHLLNASRHEVGSDGLMFAATNFDPGGPKVTCVCADALQGDSVQMKQY